MTDPIDEAKNGFIKAEPVMAAHIAAAAVGFVMSLLVTHGVVTTIQASSLTQTLIPPMTAAALLLLGLLVRSVVTPAAKLAAKVEAGVEAKLNPPAGPKHAAAPPVVPAGPSVADQTAQILQP